MLVMAYYRRLFFGQGQLYKFKYLHMHVLTEVWFLDLSSLNEKGIH